MKKALSIILSLTMILGVLAIAPLKASAAIEGFTLPSIVEPQSVTVKEPKMTVYKDTIHLLSATVKPDNAEPKLVTWSSSNKSVALTVGNILYAVAPGTARLTAKTINGKTSVCTVTVLLYSPVVTKIASINGAVRLNWDKVGGAAKYRVFCHDGTTWRKIADTTATTYDHKRVVSGKKYTYTVRCVTKDGKQFTSDYNHKGWSITYVAAPQPPTLKNTKNGVQVSWKRVAGAAKYRVFRKVGSGEWIKLADTDKAYLDKTAKNGVTYRYTVRCLNKNGKYVSAYTNGSVIKCKR